jgi:predicted esterase
MTRLQLSLLLSTLGALTAAAGCEDPGDPGCVGVNCGYDSSIGPITGTGGTGVDAGPPGAPAGGPGAGTTGGAAAGGMSAGGLPGSGVAGGSTGGFPAGGLPSGGGTTGGGTTGGLTGGGTTGGGTTGGTTGGGMLPPAGGSGAPKIPEIKGECPEFKNGTVMVGGHRGVQLTVGAAGKNGAILFYWHGTYGAASQVSMVPASVRNEIISTGGIIASFNGPDSSQAAGDCSGTGEHNIADFDAADQIVACAVKNHGIDPRRIYTTGCSAGGLQAGCMAQLRSSYIAASAPNSGGVVFSQRWQDTGKPAIFTMHGGPDDWVIVAFSETSATLDMSAKSHGSFVVNCDHMGGHCAASAALQQASWQFMKDHPYGAESPWKNAIPSGIPSFCKIY